MLTKNNSKKILQNEKFELHSECIIHINDLHDELLKERTNYVILENKYNIIEKENKELNIKVDDLLLWKKNHTMNMEDTKKIIKDEMYKNYINKEINVKETPEYIDLKNINEDYNKKIINLESKLEKINTNIEDNVLFKNIKEQNILLSEANKTLKTNYEKIELDNKKIKQYILDIKKDKYIKTDNKQIEDITSKINIESPISENIKLDCHINQKKKKMDKIIEDNINKIIIKIDKLYLKDFSEEQLTVNKALINFYSDIYDLIKNKDEKKDARYINDIIDSASTDTNKTRFKKILKVSNFINNNTFLKESSIVIPLYIFKIIPINSLDTLFYNINDYFKDKINDDNDGSDIIDDNNN